MSKKRLATFIVAITAVAGGFIYSNNNIQIFNSKVESSSKSVKNEEKPNAKEDKESESKADVSNISDTEAIKIASKAIKDYLNKDSASFNETKVKRQDWSQNTRIEVDGKKYIVNKKNAEWIQKKLDLQDIKGAKEELEWALKERPNVITVTFTNTTLDNNAKSSSIDIDSDTKEIIGAITHNEMKEFKGEADKNRIKEVVINFFTRINVEIDKESILEDCDIEYDFGTAVLGVKLKSSETASIVMDLNSYSVISYNKN